MKTMHDVLPQQQKPTPSPSQRTKRKGRQRLLYVGIFLLVSVCIATSVLWWFVQKRSAPDLNEVSVIKSLVGELFVLPVDEEPALFTVTDKRQVTTEFLKVSENGDKVLVYQKNKRIIIYRPSIDKIVDVGPVSIASTP